MVQATCPQACLSPPLSPPRWRPAAAKGHPPTSPLPLLESRRPRVLRVPSRPPRGCQDWCEPAVSPLGAVSPHNLPPAQLGRRRFGAPGRGNAVLTWAAALLSPGATRAPSSSARPRTLIATAGPALLLQRLGLRLLRRRGAKCCLRVRAALAAVPAPCPPRRRVRSVWLKLPAVRPVTNLRGRRRAGGLLPPGATRLRLPRLRWAAGDQG